MPMFYLRKILDAAQGTHRGFLSRMGVGEAAKILGLGRSWSARDVNSNYRTLLMRNHPDRGGSEYIAKKLNEAREMVLNR